MNGLRKYNYIKNKRVEEEVKLFMFIHNLLSLLTYAVKQWRRKYFVKFTHETCSCDASCIFFIATRRTKECTTANRTFFLNEKNVMIYTGRRIKFIFTCKDISNVYFFFSIHSRTILTTLKQQIESFFGKRDLFVNRRNHCKENIYKKRKKLFKKRDRERS